MDNQEQIIANRELTRRALDAALSKRPPGWSRKSISPYYSQHNAEWLASHIDQMIATRRVLFFQLKEMKLSHNSLYHKINQGCRFLCDRLETADGKWRLWLDSVKIQTVKGVGIKISFKENGIDEEGNPMLIEEGDETPIWIRRMEKYLESNDVEPFIMEGLHMNFEQAKEIKKQLSELKGIDFSVTPTAIKIIKI